MALTLACAHAWPDSKRILGCAPLQENPTLYLVGSVLWLRSLLAFASVSVLERLPPGLQGSRCAVLPMAALRASDSPTLPQEGELLKVVKVIPGCMILQCVLPRNVADDTEPTGYKYVCAVTQIGVDVERKPRAEPEDVRDDENWQQRPRKMRRGRRGSGKKASEHDGSGNVASSGVPLGGPSCGVWVEDSSKPKDDDNGMIEIEVDDEPTSPADEALAAKEWEAPKENTGWWSTSSQDWSSDRCGTSSQDWRSGWWGTAHDNDQDWSSGWWGTTSRWR